MAAFSFFLGNRAFFVYKYLNNVNSAISYLIEEMSATLFSDVVEKVGRYS